jgi:hypothetical protein
MRIVPRNNHKPADGPHVLAGRVYKAIGRADGSVRVVGLGPEGLDSATLQASEYHKMPEKG